MQVSVLQTVLHRLLLYVRRRRLVVYGMLFLVGSAFFMMLHSKVVLATIDTHHLQGKVFFIEQGWGGDTPQTNGRSYIMVMNADGTGSRILIEKFDRVLSLGWDPRLRSLETQAWATASMLADTHDDNLYTLKVEGRNASDVSVSKIERPLPDDFRTRFYEPIWDYKDGHSIPIPNTRSYTTRITFSPDGTRIAGLVRVLNTESNQTKLRLCVVPTDGSAPESCNLSVEGCGAQSPVWSPDGTKVVFAGALKDDSMTYACNMMELYVYDVNKKTSNQITNIVGPRIPENNHGVVKSGMKPGYFHKSTHPQWSPDGRWIAFMSFGGIFRVHPDGTEPQLIIRDGYFPTWSPDGSMLMYVIKTGNPIAITGPSDHIFVAHADGSDPTEIPLDDKCLSRCSYEDLNWAE